MKIKNDTPTNPSIMKSSINLKGLPIFLLIKQQSDLLEELLIVRTKNLEIFYKYLSGLSPIITEKYHTLK